MFSAKVGDEIEEMLFDRVDGGIPKDDDKAEKWEDLFMELMTELATKVKTIKESLSRTTNPNPGHSDGEQTIPQWI